MKQVRGMPSFSPTVLGGSSPIGVAAEATATGVRVNISSGTVSFSDRRIWISALFQFGVVFVLFAAFFGLNGVFRVHPHFWAIVLGLSIFAGVVSAIQTRAALSKRRSMPAKLELTADRLIIDEPSFNYLRQGTRVEVAPLHMEYALAEIDSFNITSAKNFDPVEGSLQIHLTSRLNEYHLKGRNADQLQWVCQCLSGALRSVKMRSSSPSQSQPSSGMVIESFVYDESGLRKGE